MRVGIVGTGEMGRPLIDRLLATGHDVAAYARRREVREDLAAAGVELVASVADLGLNREVVLIYVYRDDQAQEVTAELEPGPLVVIHTTGSPLTAATLAHRGHRVVDAPGSGGPAQVAAGALTLFVGGDPEDVERCRPLFRAYAQHVEHVGPLGSGQRVKLLNNLLFGAHVELALEASRIADAFGLDVPQVMRTLHSCSGGSYAVDFVAAMGSADAQLRAAGRFVRKDIEVARSLAAQLDIPLGTIDAATRPFLDR